MGVRFQRFSVCFFFWKLGKTHSEESWHIPEKLGWGEMRGSRSLGKLPTFPGLEFMGTARKNQGCAAREDFSRDFQRFSCRVCCWQLFPFKSWKSRNSNKIPVGFIHWTAQECPAGIPEVFPDFFQDVLGALSPDSSILGMPERELPQE